MARGVEGFDDDVTMQAAFCTARGAPVYASLLRAAAGSDVVRAALSSVWKDRDFDALYERPLLFCTALRHAAMTTPGHPLALALGEGADGQGEVGSEHVEAVLSDEALLAVLRHRFVQTNEVSRALAWRLVLSTWPGPRGARVHLVDLGCSAGLNLVADGLAGEWIDASGHALSVETRAVVASRTGLDRAPMDVRTNADAAWLRACVWPGQTDRLHRLDAAIAHARASTVTIATCKAEDMPDRLSRIAADHSDDHVLAYSTVFFGYLTPSEKTALTEGMHAWLRQYSPRVLWAELEAGTGEITPTLPAEVRVSWWNEAAAGIRTQRLARCDYHTNAVTDVVRFGATAVAGGD
jgi:hypothetical protein